MSGTLLVIDWDNFFAQPYEGGDDSLYPYVEHASWYFDWSHAENPLFTGPVLWTDRAATLHAAEPAPGYEQPIPLPTVNTWWQRFSDRFQYADEARLYVADSNAFAGLVRPEDNTAWDDVWLYDAHHDCGYNINSYDTWRSRFLKRGERWSAEDWMLVHKYLGEQDAAAGGQPTRLHYRAPAWHKRYREDGMEIPDGVGLDFDYDISFHDVLPQNMQHRIGEVDAVFVCRSGAWVPPWCDPQFAQFVDTLVSAVGADPEFFGTEGDPITNRDDFIRPWGEKEMEGVQHYAEVLRSMREVLN